MTGEESHADLLHHGEGASPHGVGIALRRLRSVAGREPKPGECCGRNREAYPNYSSARAAGTGYGRGFSSLRWRCADVPASCLSIAGPPAAPIGAPIRPLAVWTCWPRGLGGHLDLRLLSSRLRHVRHVSVVRRGVYFPRTEIYGTSPISWAICPNGWNPYVSPGSPSWVKPGKTECAGRPAKGAALANPFVHGKRAMGLEPTTLSLGS
jgi:hypothetical protein